MNGKQGIDILHDNHTLTIASIIQELVNKYMVNK